jgi:superfamily I DNA/RNA helicase
MEALVEALCPEEHRAAALDAVALLAAQVHGIEPDIRQWGPRVLALSAMMSEADTLSTSSEAVSLLTLHASKGLEFRVVFITGCEEGLLPHLRAGEEEERVAEERRLFYVGMTRAERLLVLTHASKRLFHGKVRARSPSRFLQEIGSALVHYVEREPLPRRRLKQLDLF